MFRSSFYFCNFLCFGFIISFYHCSNFEYLFTVCSFYQEDNSYIVLKWQHCGIVVSILHLGMEYMCFHCSSLGSLMDVLFWKYHLFLLGSGSCVNKWNDICVAFFSLSTGFCFFFNSYDTLNSQFLPLLQCIY